MPDRRTPETLVAPPLCAFLETLIDYAGLFPPADLPLSEALPAYARYRHTPDAWMLGRFILPTHRLGDLDAFAALLADGPPFLFSVLGTGAPHADAFLDTLHADLQALDALHARYPGQVRAGAMEVRLPAALLGSNEAALHPFFDAVGHATVRHNLELFFEVPIDARVRETVPPVLDALAAYNRVFATPAGFKMRTGGLEPNAFPAAGDLAFALAACRERGIHFKATAGLHHPVRQYHASVGTHMYGFFNVFGAAVLSVVHALEEDTLRAILLDEDPAHFQFTAEAFAWNDLTATPEAIRQVRQHFACSFGSCSFDEPRDDLRALGLL